MSQCTLCSEICGDATPFGDDYNELVYSGSNVIFGSNSFVLLASIGPLNESHVMIVPRAHVMGMASLPNKSLELRLIKEYIRCYVRRLYGWEMTFFEHGTGGCSESMIACVAHAHLHALRCVPGIETLLHCAIPTIQKVNQERFFELADQELGYVFFEDALGTGYLANRPLVPPQFIRRLYAQAQGVPHKWNWRFDYRVDEVRDVLTSYDRFSQFVSVETDGLPA
jgi:ATP adenylyltransferase